MERIDVGAAVRVECQVVQTRRVSIVGRRSGLRLRALQRDAEHATGSVRQAPARRTRSRLGQTRVAELAENAIVERHGARNVRHGEVDVADGAANHPGGRCAPFGPGVT